MPAVKKEFTIIPLMIRFDEREDLDIDAIKNIIKAAIMPPITANKVENL